MVDASTEIARRSALFAHCCLLENTAVTNKAAEKIFSEVSSVTDLEIELDQQSNVWQREFVKASLKVFKKHASSEISQKTVSNKNFRASKNIDFKSWIQFKNETTPFEFLTVLWAVVLKIEVGTIAEVTKTSIGTTQYRLSRGIQKLGREVGAS